MLPSATNGKLFWPLNPSEVKGFEEKNKRRATIITIAVHVVLVILFLIFGLSQPVPLPSDRGASVEFGWDISAGGDAVVQTVSTPVQQPVPPQPTEATEASAPDIEEPAVTEDASDIAIPVEKPKEKPKPTPPKEEPKKEQPKPQEPPKPAISDKLSDALSSAWSTPGDPGGKGPETGSGAQGDPSGTTGKGVLGGGSGEWELSGRSMLPGFGTKIRDTKEEGIVVLNIWVDQNGRVTRVTPNLAESTTTSNYLINLATNDVKSNFRFNEAPGAAVEQRGKVRYVFQLK